MPIAIRSHDGCSSDSSGPRDRGEGSGTPPCEWSPRGAPASGDPFGRRLDAVRLVHGRHAARARRDRAESAGSASHSAGPDPIVHVGAGGRGAAPRFPAGGAVGSRPRSTQGDRADPREDGGGRSRDRRPRAHESTPDDQPLPRGLPGSARARPARRSTRPARLLPRGHRLGRLSRLSLALALRRFARIARTRLRQPRPVTVTRAPGPVHTVPTDPPVAH